MSIRTNLELVRAQKVQGESSEWTQTTTFWMPSLPTKPLLKIMLWRFWKFLRGRETIARFLVLMKTSVIPTITCSSWLCVRFICDKYHARRIFHGFHVKFFCDIPWFTKPCAVLYELSTLGSKALKGVLWLDRNVHRQGAGFSFFPLSKWNIMSRRSMLMELFADHFPSFIPPSCYRKWSKTRQSGIYGSTTCSSLCWAQSTEKKCSRLIYCATSPFQLSTKDPK